MTKHLAHRYRFMNIIIQKLLTHPKKDILVITPITTNRGTFNIGFTVTVKRT